MNRPLILLPAFVLCCFLMGCASTNIDVLPPEQAPICAADASGLVLWTTGWRADQKDVPDRERAAEEGLALFAKSSGCFQSAEVQRVQNLAPETVQKAIASAHAPVGKVVAVTVRELGPTVRLFASPALVNGGTEVVLDIAEYAPATAQSLRTFTVHWTNGGPGVIKGVSSLPQDMQAALTAGLKP